MKRANVSLKGIGPSSFDKLCIPMHVNIEDEILIRNSSLSRDFHWENKTGRLKRSIVLDTILMVATVFRYMATFFSRRREIFILRMPESYPKTSEDLPRRS